VHFQLKFKLFSSNYSNLLINDTFVHLKFYAIDKLLAPSDLVAPCAYAGGHFFQTGNREEFVYSAGIMVAMCGTRRFGGQRMTVVVNLPRKFVSGGDCTGVVFTT